jgi:hypothetical protein
MSEFCLSSLFFSFPTFEINVLYLLVRKGLGVGILGHIFDDPPDDFSLGI